MQYTVGICKRLRWCCFTSVLHGGGGEDGANEEEGAQGIQIFFAVSAACWQQQSSATQRWKPQLVVFVLCIAACIRVFRGGPGANGVADLFGIGAQGSQMCVPFFRPFVCCANMYAAGSICSTHISSVRGGRCLLHVCLRACVRGLLGQRSGRPGRHRCATSLFCNCCGCCCINCQHSICSRK
jgi:hypothetical protein